MAVAGFFAGEMATELLDTLLTISRKSLLCRTSADQLITYIEELLPSIEEIKYSGVELPAARQSQLDRLSEVLRSGVELSHKVLESSRWNIYKNLQLARKMEKLEKTVSRFVQGPMQAHIFADVHRTRFEMVDRFDRIDASHRQLAQYFGIIGVDRGGGWMEDPFRIMEEDERVEGNSEKLGVGLDLGRRKVREMIVQKQHLVVGICGIGGCGKTTLAREVCQDDQIRSHFKERILFLTVSQSPNVKQLRAKIRGYIRDNENLNSNYWIPRWKRPQIESKTGILVVLDDVWSHSVLEQLVGIPGCKFLVVSRFRFPTIFTTAYDVELLSEEDALSLFCHHAFGQKSIPPAADENLVKQVVAECGRLPLALKVIAASSRDQSEMFWASVKTRLSRGQSIGESHEVNLLQRMAKSINYLHEKTKECFLDLCCFPKDKKIPLEVLINMWVEIHDIDEAEAYAIVIELSNKNLLTLVKESRAGAMHTSCFEICVTQHVVLRDLALQLSSRGSINERQRLVMPKSEKGIPKEWLRCMDRPLKARMVSIHTGEMREMDWSKIDFPKAEVLIINFSSSEYFLPPFLDRMPKLSALIVINYSASYASIQNFSMFHSLANLRSLWLEKVSIPQLSGIPLKSLHRLFIVLCKINNNLYENMVDMPQIFPCLSELTLDHCDNLTDLPPSICEMQTLQNLTLTHCHNLSQLPADLGKLSSLQILRLYGCPELKSLPLSICELVRLKYIDISQCVNLASFPENIGKLVSLEKIDMRECSVIKNLPKSVVSLQSLRVVICEEEVSWMWEDIQRVKPNVHVQVSEHCFDVDWLNEQ